MTDYSDPWWGHISGKCIDDCPWCHINELQAELTALKEKARAAVNAPYEDILDMGLAQALRELGEVL